MVGHLVARETDALERQLQRAAALEGVAEEGDAEPRLDRPVWSVPSIDLEPSPALKSRRNDERVISQSASTACSPGISFSRGGLGERIIGSFMAVVQKWRISATMNVLSAALSAAAARRPTRCSAAAERRSEPGRRSNILIALISGRVREIEKYKAAGGMARPPHVLLIVADDLPRNVLKSYGASHGLPSNLDAIGGAGLTFERAYPSHLCARRAGTLLTGGTRARRASAGGTRVRPGRSRSRRISRASRMSTLAAVMRRGGYLAGFVGKYHIGRALQPRVPAADGPNASLAQAAASAPRSVAVGRRSALPPPTTGKRARAALKKHSGFEFVADVYFGNDALTAWAHEPERMAHEALRMVRRARERRRPFFVVLALTLTHAPLGCTGSVRAAARGAARPRRPAAADRRPVGRRRRRGGLEVVRRLRTGGLLCGGGDGAEGAAAVRAAARGRDPARPRAVAARGVVPRRELGAAQLPAPWRRR